MALWLVARNVANELHSEVLNELQNGRNWLVTVYLYLSSLVDHFFGPMFFHDSGRVRHRPTPQVLRFWDTPRIQLGQIGMEHLFESDFG